MRIFKVSEYRPKYPETIYYEGANGKKCSFYYNSDYKGYVLERVGGSVRQTWNRHKIDALDDVGYEKFLHDLIDVVRDDIY